MDSSNLNITPELREALLSTGGQPVQLVDQETKKVYLLVEQGVLPELDEAYVRDALEIARGEIARGEVSSATVEEIIGKARTAQATQSK